MATMDAPASERNKVPILETLTSNGMFLRNSEGPISVLEVAAGAGVHSVYLTEGLQKAGFNLDRCELALSRSGEGHSDE